MTTWGVMLSEGFAQRNISDHFFAVNAAQGEMIGDSSLHSE
jgi:hypothetical protein